MAETKTQTSAPDASAPSYIVERTIVSAPGRVIQVERLEISEEQRAAVAAALERGRQSARIRK
jgi:hypothetical protein